MAEKPWDGGVKMIRREERGSRGVRLEEDRYLSASY